MPLKPVLCLQGPRKLVPWDLMAESVSWSGSEGTGSWSGVTCWVVRLGFPLPGLSFPICKWALQYLLFFPLCKDRGLVGGDLIFLVSRCPEAGAGVRELPTPDPFLNTANLAHGAGPCLGRK